ncbi:hypothetical protein TRFO_03834 [Tritrichomonas foetus]|uniref:Uncharacterized protein n=1 Tax=Tritrichomonas foetus TaxID=1144522 RepID=A0A1J4KPB2_9EUKA|nr:hypothetical protein TRFO_03834 [Tritrichomonas foetus]|eukprot:OHT11636.1 hypothetical protein TRFO_03834 [Tritrichomonas foetus]
MLCIIAIDNYNMKFYEKCRDIVFPVIFTINSPQIFQKKMKSLRIELEQIYNPTNDWMACTLASSGSKVYVSPIPPRSTRPLPANIVDPQIILESVLSSSSIAKFTSSNAVVSSSVIVESLDLHIQGKWTGEAHIADVTHEITSIACINEKEVTGWFSIDTTIYFFVGNLNTLSKSISYTIYESTAVRKTDVRGAISNEGGKYALSGKSGDFSFSLCLDQNQSRGIKEDPNISGSYVGFYERGPHSFELHADLNSLDNGIINGRGTEESRQFTIFGMIDFSKKRYFFVRNKGNDITYYNGEAQLTDEIFFQGEWKMGSISGGFTLIKCMENDSKNQPVK